MDIIVGGTLVTLLSLSGLWMFVALRERAAQATRDAPETRFGLHTHGIERRRPDAQKLQVEWQRHGEWLRRAWAGERQELANGNLSEDRMWRLERITVEMAVELPDCNGGRFIPTFRGQIYDLSGLLEPATQSQQDMLEFFGLNTRLSRTLAERELGRIMQSEKRVRAWLRRPVTPLQQLFFSLMGLGLHPKLTAEAAQPIMDEYLAQRSDAELLANWVSLESIFRDLSNATIAAQYGLTPPAPKHVLHVFKALRREGFAAQELYIRLNLVAQRLVAFQPKHAAQRGNNSGFKESSRERV